MHSRGTAGVHEWARTPGEVRPHFSLRAARLVGCDDVGVLAIAVVQAEVGVGHGTHRVGHGAGNALVELFAQTEHAAVQRAADLPGGAVEARVQGGHAALAAEIQVAVFHDDSGRRV